MGLAELHYNSLGLPKRDYVIAYKWYTIAAGLGSKATLSGIGNLFELWDADTFDRRNADTADALAADAAAGDLPDVLMDISL